MSARPAYAAKAGFTLLEMLVGLALLSVMIAALAGATRSGALLEGREAVRAETRLAHDEARRALTLLVENHRGALTGDSGRLSFLVEKPPAASGGGLYQIEITRQSDAIIAEWRALAGAARGESLLLAGAAGLRFAYFGAPVPEATPVWSARWRSRRPPALIRVTLARNGPGFAESGEREQVIYLRPRAEGAADNR